MCMYPHLISKRRLAAGEKWRGREPDDGARWCQPWLLSPASPARTGFTLYLDRSSFPVDSGCQSEWLKLRMKTLGEGAQTKEAIDAKRQLWESIQKVAAGELAHLDVILELNPYCRVINAEPLEVRLDYCNVSFRSVDGYYVDHTEAVIVTPILP